MFGVIDVRGIIIIYINYTNFDKSQKNQKILINKIYNYIIKKRASQRH